MKNVSNELESSGAHQAVWIDPKGNVVNGLATMYRFRNHELFVFRPGKLSGQMRDRSARVSAPRRSRLLEQFANHGVEGIHRWRFLAALVGGKYRAKAVCRGENQLSKVGAARLSNLRGKNILEFVRQLTQLVKSTGCGITLQSVHGSTDTTNHILVGGAGFELEPSLVQRL